MSVKEKAAQQQPVKQEQNLTKKFDVTYAVAAIIAIIAVLAASAGLYFTKSYVMFSPEKVAQQYAANTAQLNGYDALKYTVLIKNTKLGDFMIKNYMEQYTGNKDKDAQAPVLTAEEEGEKLTQILNAMYPFFTDLVDGYGFENYNEVFSRYFAAYVVQHQEIYGHDLMSTDDMFAAFEGNLATYMEYYAYDCESVYGKGEAYAALYLGDNKQVLTDGSEQYSAGYRISAETEILKEYTDEEAQSYIAALSADKKTAFAHFNINLEDISAVAQVRATRVVTGSGNAAAIEAKNAEWKEHPETITLVKVGAQWYVDFTA